MRTTEYAHPTLKEQAAERAAAIQSLGWAAEDGTADGRYAATTTEMLGWIREDAEKARAAVRS